MAQVGCWELQVLGGFRLLGDGADVDLGTGQQRLVAMLALRDRPVQRESLAAVLWPAADDAQAAHCLRNTVWRLHTTAPGLVRPSRREVALSMPSLRVDLTMSNAVARQLLAGTDQDPTWEELTLLAHELLPDWDDEWVVVEREHFHQTRLHALEAASRSLTAKGHLGLAVEAATFAVDGEPLRESAHRVLIEAHIREGNWAAAMTQFDRCRRLLHEELGVSPTPELTALVAPARPEPVRPGRGAGVRPGSGPVLT